MAKLADAYVSEAYGSDPLEVQVLFRAHKKESSIARFFLCVHGWDYVATPKSRRPAMAGREYSIENIVPDQSALPGTKGKDQVRPGLFSFLFVEDDLYLAKLALRMKKDLQIHKMH